MANYLTVCAVEIGPKPRPMRAGRIAVSASIVIARNASLLFTPTWKSGPLKGRVTDIVKRGFSAPVVALECALRLKPKSTPSNAVLLETEMADTGRFHVTIVRG